MFVISDHIRMDFDEAMMSEVKVEVDIAGEAELEDLESGQCDSDGSWNLLSLCMPCQHQRKKSYSLDIGMQ